MANDVEITVRVRDLTGSGFASVNRNLDQMGVRASAASKAVGSGGASGGGLTGALYGVAAVAGATLAPTLGALVPMMAGVGLAAATLKLGFAGIGDALKDQSTDAKKYKEDLKAMSPASRDLTKTLVDLKKEFSGTGKEIQKAMLPGFTSALKAAHPEVKAVRGAMVDMGKVFGDAAKGVGKLMKDSGFQKDFAKNLKLGTGFVKDMTRSMGPFTQSLLHFGAVSDKSLGAFSKGIGDLLGKGLPGFFKGLEPGISGASDMLTGLFDAVNLIVPAVGRLSGSLAKNLGPLFGELLKHAGLIISAFADGLSPALDALGPTANSAADALSAMDKYVQPLAKGLGTVLAGAIKVVAPVFKNLFDLATIAGPIFVDLATAIGGPLLSAFSDVTGAGKGLDNFGGGLKDFGNWVHDNRASIDKGIRSIAVSILDMVTAAVDAAPTVFNAFKTMTMGVLDVLGVLANGAVATLGWVPGLGGKLMDAAGKFNDFKASVGGSLDATGEDIQAFHDSAMPKLKAQRMSLDVSPFNAALGVAGKALRGMPKPKAAKLIAQDRVTAAVKAAQRAVDALMGKTVYITYQGKFSGLAGGSLGQHAHGGIIGAYANGGTTSGSLSLVGEQGPEIVRLPVGSTVYPAGQSQRMMDDGAEPVRAYAKGGKVTAAEKSARSSAMGSFGISYFARMAGAQHTSFESSVGSPGSLGDLVSTLNQWRASIKAATSGGVEKSLLAGLTRAGKGLIAHEKALTKVNAALASAKDKLTSLKDAAAQLRDSVASGIVSGANITGTAQSSGLTSTGRILDQLTQDRDKASSLAGALKTLKGRGLNSQSLSEIASAGVQGGGLATAEALMSASGGDIQQINQLEKQLKLSAASAGKTTADSMYGAGIKAADGLVKGLERQQHRLDAVMAKAAKALEKAIERAFKGKATGGIVGAATGGARGGLTWVGEQGPELARLPYGSTVYPAGQSRQMATAGGGGGAQRVVVEFDFRSGGSPFELALIDTLRKGVKTRGGNVQVVLGKGSG
jgi:hypothetical protein